MRLTSFQVCKFRNIVDSTPIAVEEGVTCLVGKNESGKTALLQALYRLKPAYPSKFDLDEHYPRWLKVRDVRNGDAAAAKPIEAVFTLDDDDRAAVAEIVGEGVLNSDTYTRWCKYDGRPGANGAVDEAALVRNLMDRLDISTASAKKLRECKTVAELRPMITTLRAKVSEQNPGDATAAAEAELSAIDAELSATLGDKTVWQIVEAVLWSRMPTFFYFSDYSILPGRVDLQELAQSATDKPGETDIQTARALLTMAGTDTSRLRQEDYEVRKAELEAVSNELSREVFEYWKQNENLSVIIDVDKETKQLDSGQTAVARYLDVRVHDRRHGYTNNFGQRSSGFQWFFSFLAAFSEFEYLEQGVIVLLDEPGLSLHGKAQADFLRFINKRLASGAQVLYTTHSPFMVEMGHLDRVRIIEDRGPEQGAIATQEVLGIHPDSLFPLQGALSYDIAQMLFVGPHNLVLEGTSDFTYLTVISDHLATLKRSRLDLRWRVTLTGGASTIPAYVSMIGPHLDVTVVVDAGTEGMQRLTNMTKKGLLPGQRLITVAEITGTNVADIEDLFTVDDYLSLYNAAGVKPAISEKKLKPGDRIVKRIAAAGSGDFDHGVPADYLLRHRDTVLPTLSPDTLGNFERLIERINATIAT